MATRLAQLVVANSPQDLKALVAQHVASSARAAIESRGSFTMALSGGSLPQNLADLATAPGVDWTKVWVMFADERLVPIDHEESNFKPCHEHLFSKVPLQAAQVLAVNAALSPEEAAADYQARMLAALKLSPDTTEIAQLDCLLLGMGPDGHTASLFPGHPLLHESIKQVASITDSPKPPPERITMTFPVLNNAREVIFIAAGEAKAPLFKEALEAAPSSEQSDTVRVRSGLPYPAFQVAPSRGKVTWYTDEAGASQLPEAVRRRAAL